MKIIPLLIFFICTAQSQQQTILLKEEHLKDYVQEGVVQLDRLENIWKEELIRLEQNKDLLTPVLIGNVSEERTNRRPIFKFSPVSSPINRGTVTWKQKTLYGVDTLGTLGAEIQKFNFDGNAINVSALVLELQTSINLWQNFKGKLDQWDRYGLDASSHASKLKKEVQTHGLYLELKRIYYDLIINHQAHQLAKLRYDQAIAQTQYAKNKLGLYATDTGEVDRFIAQQESRQQAIYQLELQKESILLGLKNKFHQFNGPGITVKVDSFDMLKKQQSVLACLKQITMVPNVPAHFSHVGKIRHEMDKFFEAKIQKANSYQEMDFSLDFAFRTNGVEKTFIKSLDDGLLHNRLGFKIGLNLTIPLPGENRTKRLMLNKIHREKELTYRETDLQLSSLHDYAKNSLTILMKNMESAHTMTKALEKRVHVMQNKFEQGRVSVSEFIQDQDTLLESQYAGLNNQQTIVHGLITYLQTYHLFPCEFNQ